MGRNFRRVRNRSELNQAKRYQIRYKKEKKINSGSYGQIFMALDTQENRNVVIKQVKLECYLELIREIHFLRGLYQHAPNYFVNILDVVVDRENDQIMMIMEYFPWTLDDLMRHDTEKIYLLSVFQQIMEAIVIMEQHLINHFDIKPDNILIYWPETADSPQIKVIDLGFSEFFRDRPRRCPIGTDYYRPPEVFGKGLQVYGLDVDLWSMAVVLAEYYHNEHVFQGKEESDVLADIHQKMPTMDLAEYWHWFPDLGFVIQAMMNYQVETRVKAYLYMRPFIYENLGYNRHGEQISSSETLGFTGSCELIELSDTTVSSDTTDGTQNEIEGLMLAAEVALTEPELYSGPPVEPGYFHYQPLIPLPTVSLILADHQTLFEKDILRIGHIQWIAILLKSLEVIEALEDPNSSAVAWSAFYQILIKTLKSYSHRVQTRDPLRVCPKDKSDPVPDLKLIISSSLYLVSQIYYYKPLRLRDFLDIGEIYLGWRYDSQLVDRFQLKLLRFL